MGKPTFERTKDPDEVLDYTMDWTTAPWLSGSDTIDTSTVTVESGITLDSSSNTTTTQTAWLSGGTDGSAYEVEFKITTVGGRTGVRTLRVFVSER
jgi:hypothetical protein